MTTKAAYNGLLKKYLEEAPERGVKIESEELPTFGEVTLSNPGFRRTKRGIDRFSILPIGEETDAVQGDSPVDFRVAEQSEGQDRKDQERAG